MSAVEALARNKYFDPHFNIDAAKVLPGEYYVTDRDMMMVTVLGSCVSCCLRDPLAGVSGMNHFMLPEGTGPGLASRYGIHAMELLVNELLKRGARRDRLEAKVFGGGNVMPGFVTDPVGERNAAFVLEFLRTEKLRCSAQDLLDRWPRKVYFWNATGKVLVKALRTVANETLLERELDYKRHLTEAPASGEIELFS
ncbi:chemotaxis protein CheD [Betaproteobacteria bacterium GR16-43]|nr:chemotaxis protein CheD [Betaproteobacteria bacterium GR16-43]